MTPLQFMQRYMTMAVVYGDAAAGGGEIVFRQLQNIRLRRYVIARTQPSNPRAANYQRRLRQWNEFAADLRVKDRLLRMGRRRQAIEGSERTRIAQAFYGKGRPEDYELALEVACLLGVCASTQQSVQQFCDDHLGIDCSGFVNAYFQNEGTLTGNASRTISQYYSQRQALRTDVRQIRQSDLLIWVTAQGRLFRNPGHIALVNGARGVAPAGAAAGAVRAAGAAAGAAGVAASAVAAAGLAAVRAANLGSIDVVESTGGIGLCNSTYEVRRYDARRQMFRVYRPRKQSQSWVKIVQPFR
jgi:cell wall-associated NlpC family hydrolase